MKIMNLGKLEVVWMKFSNTANRREVYGRKKEVFNLLCLLMWKRVETKYRKWVKGMK